MPDDLALSVVPKLRINPPFLDVSSEATNQVSFAEVLYFRKQTCNNIWPIWEVEG